MKSQSEHLENLSEIRSLMERSSRFISLSGLSGVFVGIFALAGAAAAYWYLESNQDISYSDKGAILTAAFDAYIFLFIDALLVLTLSLVFVAYFTIRKAREKGQTIWDATAQRLLINLAIPLATGGFFCLVLMQHGQFQLIAPSMLIFYGLALINASRYTLNDIRYLGICEIILGLISAVFFGYGLIFWAIGFGVLHIIYGSVMYNKYEK
jgi:hypothetical protein